MRIYIPIVSSALAVAGIIGVIWHNDRNVKAEVQALEVAAMEGNCTTIQAAIIPLLQRTENSIRQNPSKQLKQLAHHCELLSSSAARSLPVAFAIYSYFPSSHPKLKVPQRSQVLDTNLDFPELKGLGIWTKNQQTILKLAEFDLIEPMLQALFANSKYTAEELRLSGLTRDRVKLIQGQVVPLLQGGETRLFELGVKDSAPLFEALGRRPVEYQKFRPNEQKRYRDIKDPLLRAIVNAACTNATEFTILKDRFPLSNGLLSPHQPDLIEVGGAKNLSQLRYVLCRAEMQDSKVIETCRYTTSPWPGMGMTGHKGLRFSRRETWHLVAVPENHISASLTVVAKSGECPGQISEMWANPFTVAVKPDKEAIATWLAQFFSRD